MRPILLHIHVPRASGSSLHAWFLQTVGKNGVAQANAAADVQAAVATRGLPDRPAVVSGHFIHGVHDLLEGHPHRYVVLLRDPVQRVLSLFRYMHSLPGHKSHALMNQPGMTIARYYADRVPSGGPRNGMVAQLSGILGERVTPAEEHLEQACDNLLSGAALVGLADNPAPLLKQAARYLSVRKPPAFPEVNRLRPRGEPWGGSDEDIAAIVANNQLDIELYRRAKAHLTPRSLLVRASRAALDLVGGDHRRTS